MNDQFQPHGSSQDDRSQGNSQTNLDWTENNLGETPDDDQHRSEPNEDHQNDSHRRLINQGHTLRRSRPKQKCYRKKDQIKHKRGQTTEHILEPHEAPSTDSQRERQQATGSGKKNRDPQPKSRNKRKCPLGHSGLISNPSTHRT
jgi:hypothetical protein